MQFDLEVETGAPDVRSEPAVFARDGDRPIEHDPRERVFRAQVDVAAICADGKSCDQHAFDQGQGVTLHQHAV